MDEQSLRFFQQQMEWCKQQDMILAKIEGKLRAMRDLAQYRLVYMLDAVSVDLLNEQVVQLQREIEELELQIERPVYH